MKNKRLLSIIFTVTILLLIPLIAMRFTEEVNWTLSDFMVAGALLLGTGLLLNLILRKIASIKYRVVISAVVLIALLLLWAELAVGIFGSMAGGAQFMTQLYGVLIIGAFCVITSGIIIGALKATMGIRVSKEEEIEGLDLHEHGMDAYPDFMND